MKKNYNKKKAFTLVELIVVMAILALLAAVSIIGYTTFIKKANKSNDISIVTQINTILDAEKSTGKAPATYTDVKALLQENGITIDKLTTPNTASYVYAWDSKNNKMFLLDENKNIVELK